MDLAQTLLQAQGSYYIATQKPKTKCILIADTRERNVLRHQHELSEVQLQVKQITVGDYIIVSPDNEIMAVIERKSYDDFAASLKDGRADNRVKLVELQRKTGCRIIYLIEGPEFPKPDDKFGRIPYANIESSIFHLMMRDGAQVLRTKDTLETAKTLARFMKSMDTLCAKMQNPLNLVCPDDVFVDSAGPSKTKPEHNATTATNNTNNINTTNNTTTITSPSTNTIDELITSRHAKSDHEIVAMMWAVFKGISVETASEFIKKWTIAEVVSGKIPDIDILEHRRAHGSRISKPAAESIMEVSKNTIESKKLQIRLLRCIPGISQPAATELVGRHHLRSLISYGAAGLEMELIGANKRRLGPALAEKIIKYTNYKWQEPGQNTTINNTSNKTTAQIQDLQIQQLYKKLAEIPKDPPVYLPTAEELGLTMEDFESLLL